MKKIAFLLALILALTPLMTACGGNEEATTAGSNEDVATGETYEYNFDHLPQIDMGGDKIGFFIDKGGAKYLISDEEQKGDVVAEAVNSRNVAIENKYNFKFNMVEAETNQPTDQIRNYIMSGDTTYQMYVNVQHGGMPQLILDGYFIDWNELEYVNYDQPYWNSRVAQDINFNGKVYTMSGDMALNTYNNTNCILFNKALFDDLGIDYPYEEVYDMTWTVDKFIEIVKQGYDDLDGDTMVDPQVDRIGFTGWKYEMLQACYIGMGGKPVVADEDGLPVLNLAGERNVEIIDRVIEIFDGRNGFAESPDYGSQVNIFQSGRSLMKDGFVSWVTWNRDSDFPIGAVPYPMLNEEQGEYSSRAANIAHLCYIPITVQESEYTNLGVVLEAMTIESHNTLRPVYYDITLDLKSAGDDEDLRNMIDIILGSSTYIVEGIITTGTINQFIKSGTNTYASWYAGQERAFNKTIEDMREFYEA